MTVGDWLGLVVLGYLIYICAQLVIADFKYKKVKAKYERNRRR